MRKIIDWLLIRWLIVFRLTWSKFIHRGQITKIELDPEDYFNTSETIEVNIVRLAKKVKSSFKYTLDNYKVLYDSMRSPAQCYLDYRNGKLKDDCDGFHAAMYHILTLNGIKGYLATFISSPLNKSHTILYFINNNREFILDYTILHSSVISNTYSSTLINQYKNTKYLKKGYSVVAFGLNNWDDNKEKWEKVNKIL